MALTAGQRLALRAAYGALLSERREAFNLSKADLDAAILAVDSWVDSNAASYNSALPVAARNALTAGQKAELLYLVTYKRYVG